MTSRKKNANLKNVNDIPRIGNNLNFAGKESYKLLRTNILLSFPKNTESKVIGITSAETGDGKTTTAANLALSIAESGTRVLLIEADMRRKNTELLKTLGIENEFGLSNVLVGQSNVKEVLKRSKLNRNFYVVPAGSIPPNPSELLLSSGMDSLIESFKRVFEYIIVDLPPVNLVNDTLAATRFIDGMIFVARSTKTHKGSLSYAIGQVEFSGAKIIGIVLNDYDVLNKGYGYGNYHGKYGGKYGKYHSGYGGYYGNYGGYGSYGTPVDEKK